MLDLITVVIPTSPIKLHPSTDIIDETIGTIRKHLPDSEIIITFDGVRSEQEHYRENYEEYTRRMLWKCNYEFHNVLPIVFETHEHQVGMMRKALTLIKTPLLLYAEHDTPITPDCEIEWEGLASVLMSGEAGVIRLHHEALILACHEHLMLDSKPRKVGSVLIKRTVQWSQRPHLAKVSLYKWLIESYFTHASRTMLETVLYGRVTETYKLEGLPGWEKFRLWIYTPPGGNIKRSYTRDGRGDDPVYDMIY